MKLKLTRDSLSAGQDCYSYDIIFNCTTIVRIFYKNCKKSKQKLIQMIINSSLSLKFFCKLIIDLALSCLLYLCNLKSVNIICIGNNQSYMHSPQAVKFLVNYKRHNVLFCTLQLLYDNCCLSRALPEKPGAPICCGSNAVTANSKLTSSGNFTR